jgi:hypothetical protein
MDHTSRDPQSVSVWSGLSEDNNTSVKLFELGLGGLKEYSPQMSKQWRKRMHWGTRQPVQLVPLLGGSGFPLGREIKVFCGGDCIDWSVFKDLVFRHAGLDPDDEKLFHRILF